MLLDWFYRNIIIKLHFGIFNNTLTKYYIHVWHSVRSMILSSLFTPSGYQARPAEIYDIFLDQNNKIRKALV